MHVVPLPGNSDATVMAFPAEAAPTTTLGAEQDAYAQSSGNESQTEDHSRSIDGDDADDDDAKSSPRNPRYRALSAAQKRRRVTRACDECRRKKIKCDGKQPCTHCTVYSYDCTYDQPSNRRRNPAPQVVEALESRLQRAEALLRVFVPNIDMDDPSIDALLTQNAPPGTPQLPNSQHQPVARKAPLAPAPKPAADTDAEGQDPNLESMVSATGQLDLDERGHWDYHGHSSGLTFIRRMREQFGDILGPEKLLVRSSPFARKHPGPDFVALPYSSNSTAGSPTRSHFGGIGTTDLPPKPKAIELCADALDDAGAMLRIVHQPTFYMSLDRIYNRRPEQYENEDHKFLPLLYAVMALGCLFGKDGRDVDRRGYESLTDEGYEYFWSARQLMDITDCRDLTSLQTIVFKILFLQCSAKLSTCYAYIGVALRSAIRMGLHRSFQDSFSPIEAETRKRTFWAIRKMDTYVGAMLGLPLTLADEDIDQDLPTEVDDEFITETQILTMPAGRVSLISAANSNVKLSKIVSNIMRHIYPIKGFQSREENPRRVYSISYGKVRELENELHEWMEDLPPGFRPGAVAEPHILRIRNMLRMSYAHAQMMLYRPFLHYVPAKSPPSPIDQRSYACSAACVSVARNIIHITTEMKKSNLLVGSYWFIMYTTFFAILSLIFFALENEGSPTTHDVLRDAREGRDTLAGLAKRSMAADRCTSTLTFMFGRLEEMFAKSEEMAKQKGKASKKREAPNSVAATAARSHPDVSQVIGSKAPKRSSSYPSQALPLAAQSLRNSNIQPRPSAASVQTSNASSFYSPSMTPESVTSGFNPHPAPSIYGNTQPFLPSQTAPQMPAEAYPGSMSDLNAMMFPSGDPFAYPNPPMLTLEQSYGPNPNQNPFTMGQGQSQFLPVSAVDAGSVNIGDHEDAQFFGAMPNNMIPTSSGNQQASYDFNMSTGLGDQQQQQQPPPEWRKQDSWTRQLNEMLRGSQWQGQYPDI